MIRIVNYCKEKKPSMDSDNSNVLERALYFLDEINLSKIILKKVN